MADTIVYVRDIKTGQLLPLKATDNGDGTYRPPANINVLIKNSKVVN